MYDIIFNDLNLAASSHFATCFLLLQGLWLFQFAGRYKWSFLCLTHCKLDPMQRPVLRAVLYQKSEEEGGTYFAPTTLSSF